MQTNRRGFLMGCSAAIAALSGARLGTLALAAPDAGNGHALVVLFLRGGWDALNVLPPLDGPDRGIYEAARPGLKLPRSGERAALPLGDQFGLHPAMAPLRELYQAGALGLVTATGLTGETRSHFDAMDFIERGSSGEVGLGPLGDGWLARHLASAPGAAGGVDVLSPALSVGGSPAASLRGQDALALQDAGDFRLDDSPEGRRWLEEALSGLYRGESWLHRAGQHTLRDLRMIAGAQLAAPKGYPDSELGHSLGTVAQILRAGLGVRVATVDFGGWDTHEYQGDGGQGHLAELLGELSTALHAFWADVSGAGLGGRVTVIVQSEFGRRLTQNASGGTDHGHGGLSLLLGAGVKGGRIHGRWPGLAPGALYDGADLAVTTDYRQVLGEVLGGPAGNPHLDKVFPGFKAGPALGVVNGPAAGG
ncbi:DUF1501 domain-containing protein [Deinococcus koreensis]|uniref:DUF1501 domain-containing protein n=1 Tax=Deinococcus koreensis TaxID=2054903 RepID=A0A2K3UXU4_9DEIO|nr:DUF1501 domain-containing protein [Deinococcus koreensis]PNY81344.1 hypothetical protein CVO96_08060 [Deinococcus koreensis]